MFKLKYLLCLCLIPLLFIGCSSKKSEEKQLLVLLPEAAADSIYWKNQVEHLSDIATIIIPNFKNCSTRQQMVDQVMLSTKGKGKFALAGSSMGAWVAFEVIKQNPDRISKFCVISAWARPNEKVRQMQLKVLDKIKAGQFKELIDSYISFGISSSRLGDKVFKDKVKEGLSNIDESLFVKHMTAYLNDYASDKILPQISCPTLVIGGKDDMVCSVEEEKYITESIKNAKLALIDDAGHFVSYEQPQALSALMRYWIQYF